MELEGKVWKHKQHWLVEIPSLNVATQGKTKDEALLMIEDAIIGLMSCYFKKEIKNVEIIVNEYGKGVIGISSNNTRLLIAFSLRRQREMSGSTIQDVAGRLGSTSPNAYAQYERGKIRISIDKYEQLLEAANPCRHSLLRLV